MSPEHPYFCDDCGGKAGFRIPGCPIGHEADCPRHGEDPMEAYRLAEKWCRETGGVIP